MHYSPPRKVIPKEREIENAILLYLEKCPNVFAWKNPTAGYFDLKKKAFRRQASRFAINGVADIIMFVKYHRRSEVWFLEVKTWHGHQTKNQEAFEQLCDEWDIKYFVVRSIEDVVEILRDWGVEKIPEPI